MALWRAAARAARFTNAAETGFSARYPYSTFSDSNFSSNSYNSTPRRMTCGELRVKHVGSLVELAGSLQEKRLGRFLLLRDSYGSTQLVIPDERPDIGKRLANLPLQSFISVIGYVIQRPQGAINETMVTGQVEVSIQDLVMVRVNRGVQNKIFKDARGRTINSRAMYARNFSTSAYTKSLTTEENTKCKGNNSLIWQMKNRIETCADLNIDDVGRKVILIGWIHSLHLSRFIKLKDGHGIIQCLIPSAKIELQESLKLLNSEDLLQISGEVLARPSSQVNSQEENGDIEILVESIGKLNPELPIPTEEKIDVDVPEYNEGSVNSHACRSHTCGELNISHVGQDVTICGWLENYRMGKFFTLRDSYGVTQCILSDESNTVNALDKVSLETILEVKGCVGARPSSSVNINMATGEVEVLVSSLKVLNPASYIPFHVRSFNKPTEQLQLHNRFVYLRYPEMQHNLRTRSNVLMKMRKYLIDSNQFVEVETPTLFCRTPGGAKEFIVPTRHKGHFYSLTQSPQQHKQMLMAGGIDRYFQVARCYRDEMTRGDRQPEFTQLDIEMSFANRENILSLIEELIRCSWPHPLSSKPFPRLTYDEALSKYGSDKPDTSFDFLLQNITDQLVADKKLAHNMEDFGGFAIVLKASDFHISNSFKKMLIQTSLEKFKEVKFTISQIRDSIDQWCTKVKIFDENVMQSLVSKLELSIGDTLFISYGPKEDVCKCLGEVRIKLAKEGENHGNSNKVTKEENPLWVIDFPLFVKGDNNKLESCHHPFTAPHPEDQHLLETNPLKVRSLAYDLVIAGQEVGGGSVRIHNSQLQTKILQMLQISPLPLQHLLNALESGCPPHAGIALGIDRLIAVACDAESIRDVIAFPKSHDGKDPLSGAPSLLTPEEQALYHIQVPDSTVPTPKRKRIDN